MIENVKKGMTIYYYQYTDSFVEKGIVKDPTIKDAGFQGIKLISRVNWENGTTSGARLDHCFATEKEATDSRNAEQEKYIEKLKSEITDLISLLEFPLKHNVRDGEYCDYAAQKVYKEFVEDVKTWDYTYLVGDGKWYFITN